MSKKEGYLFDFNTFLAFLMEVSDKLLQEPLKAVLQRIVLSEGIVNVRAHTGKALALVEKLNNYEQIKEEIALKEK